MFFEIIEALLRNLDGRIGKKLRYLLYKKRFASCGKNLIIESGVKISDPKSIHIGDNVWIDRDVILIAGKSNYSTRRNIILNNLKEEGYLIIGDNVHIGVKSIIQSHGGIIINNNVGIGPLCKLYSMSHHYRFKEKSDAQNYYLTSMAPIDNQVLLIGEIRLNEGVAIGMNSIIFPGAIISKGIWISSNSTVKGNLTKEESIYGGDPCVFIKYKNS